MASGLNQVLQIIQQQQAIKERRIEQKAGFLNAAISREHEITKMDKAHDNDKERYNAQMSLQYPGVTINEDTGYVDLAGYDYTKSTAHITQNIASVTEGLMAASLSTDGDSDELSKRLLFYRQGRNKGLTHLGGSVHPTLPLEVGGDVSPGVMTPGDLDDFQKFREDLDDPMVITKMVEMGYASPDMGLTQVNGLYVADADAQEHINNFYKGFESGLADPNNKWFKTNQEYLQDEHTKMLNNIQIGDAIAGGGLSKKASRVFASSKIAVGSAVSPIWADETAVMMWRTPDGMGLATLADIEDNIDTVLGKNHPDIIGFKSFVRGLWYVGKDGGGTDATLEYLRGVGLGKKGSTGNKYMELLTKFRPSTAKALSVSYNMFIKLDKAARLSDEWIKTTNEGNLDNEGNLVKPNLDPTPFHRMMDKRGFSSKFNKLRSLEFQGMEKTPEYNSLQADIKMQLKSVRKTNPAMYKQLEQWLEIELARTSLMYIK
jgi:hypothetical protein